MQEQEKIPPRSEWRDMGINQLFEVRSQMQTRFFALVSVGAGFAPQYQKFISELDELISLRMEVPPDQD